MGSTSRDGQRVDTEPVDVAGRSGGDNINTGGGERARLHGRQIGFQSPPSGRSVFGVMQFSLGSRRRRRRLRRARLTYIKGPVTTYDDGVPGRIIFFF